MDIVPFKTSIDYFSFLIQLGELLMRDLGVQTYTVQQLAEYAYSTAGIKVFIRDETIMSNFEIIDHSKLICAMLRV